MPPWEWRPIPVTTCTRCMHAAGLQHTLSVCSNQVNLLPWQGSLVSGPFGRAKCRNRSGRMSCMHQVMHECAFVPAARCLPGGRDRRGR